MHIISSIITMDKDEFPFNNAYDWSTRKKVGQGGFGNIFSVKSKLKNENVAIKQMSMAKFDEQYKKQALRNEIAALKELNSEHTVRMYDYKIGYAYTYIVLELCNSDLKSELEKNGNKFSEDYAIAVFMQIMDGFKVLVQHKYIHRDVKPENILLKNDCYKVADYGFCRKVEIDFEKLREICGTPLYMAPQLLYSKEYTSKCDIWSLGLLFYEMLFGYSPWPTRQLNVYKRSIVCKPIAFPYNCGIGQNVRSFIVGCLQLEEENRMSWKDVFSHPLVKRKEKGHPIIHTQVSEQLLKILVRVQESSSRKLINVAELFRRYEKFMKIDRKLFHEFILELDPEITTYESETIFQTADYSKDELINMNQFKHFFIDVDYRPVDDIAARRIQEIVEMAQERKLNIRQFFDLFDKDKSSEIDAKQFCSFIKYIAPKIADNEIKLMWAKFDRDKSGKITMNQFVEEMTRSVPNQGSRVFNNFERAKRNIECMKGFLHSRHITAQKFLGKANLHQHQPMKLEEFISIVSEINYVISKEQIVDMFKYIDRNLSNTIEVGEIRQVLGI